MSMELKGKIKGCVSENEMFLQWGELHKGEGSYRAILNSGTLSRFSMFDGLVVFKNCHFWHSDQTPKLREFRPFCAFHKLGYCNFLAAPKNLV